MLTWDISQSRIAYLVSDNRFLDRSQILEGGQQDVAPLRTANIFDEVTQLLTKGNENLIFVLNAFYEPTESKVSEAAESKRGSMGWACTRRGGVG